MNYHREAKLISGIWGVIVHIIEDDDTEQLIEFNKDCSLHPPVIAFKLKVNTNPIYIAYRKNNTWYYRVFSDGATNNNFLHKRYELIEPLSPIDFYVRLFNESNQRNEFEELRPESSDPQTTRILR